METERFGEMKWWIKVGGLKFRCNIAFAEEGRRGYGMMWVGEDGSMNCQRPSTSRLAANLNLFLAII